VSTMSQKNGIFEAIVITVCIKPEIADRLVEAVGKMPWLTSFSHLDAYISRSRRPAFGPQVKAASAGIAFIDFDKDHDEAVETTQYLTQTFGSKIAIIAVAAHQNPDLILMAMRAGCTEFLQSPIKERALSDTLSRLERQWSVSPARNPQSGSILALLGAKGGVGTTTLAVHLAMYLVACHHKRVLLIDNHSELGHACVYLGLDGTHFLFSEVVRNVSRLDSELLRGFVAKHSSGLEVLSSPDASGGIKPMDFDSVAKTLDFLRTEYDYVVVDCDRSFDELNQTVIVAAARLYLVATPEVGAIRDLSRYVDRLIHIDDSAEKLHVVLNRFTSPFAINVEQVEKAIRLPINIKIPNSYPELVKSENLGEPIAPTSKSELAAEFIRWADSLVGISQSEPPVKKSKGLRALWASKSLATQS